MQTKRYNWILYFISATVITTIAVQLFWNYKNYKQNKQHVSNEIQSSFDNAIEEYFASIAKANFLTIIDTEVVSSDNHNPLKFNQNKVIEWANDKKHDFDSIINKVEKKLVGAFKYKDSNSNITITKSQRNLQHDGNLNARVKIIGTRTPSDSINLLRNLNSIYISINQDSIEYLKVDSILQKQLLNKELSLSYTLNHYKNDSILYSQKKINTDGFLSATSKSTFIRPNETIKLLYKNPFKEALSRSLAGILLSFLLSIAIITCLFYLLHIIRKQKELAEIKNDLISNITHEFKTPITTVSTALEAIRSFNSKNDKEKTEKYLSISSSQLKKLNLMVEKLLETATLDSENLLIQKEQVDINELIKNIINKNEFISSNKSISYTGPDKNIVADIDSFHFENAISNLIDNAIKYGGDAIEINVNTVLNTLEISVADDGAAIEKSQREKIFDQFYRVPKGNTHDVKGFGIGLYYTKKIVEKHGGSITLAPNTTNTVFKISLPI